MKVLCQYDSREDMVHPIVCWYDDGTDLQAVAADPTVAEAVGWEVLGQKVDGFSWEEMFQQLADRGPSQPYAYAVFTVDTLPANPSDLLEMAASQP